ncbi:uncharacterized protein LOC106163253 [Lingula anatina]|uniref:Uncharacterized protein LOC106163253 n=1 Tax=Lingula anatina TaxID=7574 RepID=A0A1S3IEG2_LINAN|nr:uncharacterized protein LOC106163253 [Lingula anatina]|eukprot:XP_013396246.1 uncharacterized protein LOC106163253 [Lingula anatina]
MWYHNANKHLIVFHLILNCGKLTHGATASLDQPRYETDQASPARQGSSVWSTPLRPQVWPGFVHRADTLDRNSRQTYLPQGYALAVSGRYDQRSPRTYKAENEAIKYMSFDKDHPKDKFGTPDFDLHGARGGFLSGLQRAFGSSVRKMFDSVGLEEQAKKPPISFLQPLDHPKDKFGTPDFDLQGARGGFLSGLHRAFGSSVRKMFDSVGLEEQAKNPPISFLQPLARVTVSVDGSQVFGRSSVWKTALAASPMMSAYDALLQAKILYDFTHPENTTTNPFRVILEPSMKRQCYIVKQVGDVSTTPLFQWSLTVISRSKEARVTVSVDGSQVFGRSSVWKTALAASPMMSAYDALLQAKILYDFTHPENTTTNPFRVILEPSMKRQCYIVKQVGDVSTTPLFQWSLTVISRSKEVLISGPCVPSKKRVVVLPGFSIRLDYAPIPRFFF